MLLSALFSLALVLATQLVDTPVPGTAIVVAGQPVDVGRAVVLWNDLKGFDGYSPRCVDQSGGCCDETWARYGTRKGLSERALPALQTIVSQLVLHFDGCVNSRSCFRSMHNRVRPGGGCGLSAHFMIDSDGTIYQTLDVAERAFHAEQENSISVGVEICNRGRYNPSELSRLPAEYRARPHRPVVINGATYDAYDFRPEQYESLVALSRTLLRLFPQMQPIIPEQNGQPLLQTLARPLDFHGIVGHLHVDMQRQKWDPGAFDWNALTRALRGFAFPVQVRAFSELPRTRDELLAARRAAHFASEERVTGFFPMAPERLWHSGAHLRALAGSPVKAPARGRLLAARRAGDRSFVLLRHEVNLGEAPLVFYSLLFHLELAKSDRSVAWMQRLPAKTQAALDAGHVVMLDERVETGDVLGLVGRVNRGPEQGPEIHFEIFTVERPTPWLEHIFQFVDAASDGPLVQRAGLLAAADRDGDGQIDASEVRRLFRDRDRGPRQVLRRLAVRHRHEWGDRTTLAEFMELPELSGLPQAERQALYASAIEPYTFWTDSLGAHAGLPLHQIITSYHPLTFLLALAARSAQVDLPWPRDRISDAKIAPRRLASVPISDWTKPAEAPHELKLPPLEGVDLLPKSKEQIPLIELSSTDER
jgi:N-acetyl-anhydromuramyl-L-alanine amidase AmpD